MKTDRKRPQKEKKKKRIPTTVMESIPYRSVYKNGIIEDYDGRFSKTYRLKNTNFDVEEIEKQESMVLAYERFINCIDENMIGQLTIINRSVDQDQIKNGILMKPKNDGQNWMRSEWNEIFSSHLESGKNNLTKDKLFTISVAASDIMAATDILKRADRDVAKNVHRINHQETMPLTIDERMEILYDIYRCGSALPFMRRVEPLLENGQINLDLLASHGMSSKELFAPDSMEFKSSMFSLGDDLYGKTFLLDHLPTRLSTSILNDISNLACNMITSVTFVQMDQDKASELIKTRTNSMNAQINRMQSDAAKEGIYNTGVVSAELENARDQASELMSDVLKRNQKIFKVTVLITLLAHTQEELSSQIEMLKSIVIPHLCLLRSLNNQMETAFNTSLPLAQMQIEANRILTTEASAVFMPFDIQDLNQVDGIYYGVNPISGNMIRYNRKTGPNYGALVFGASGSGKSFNVKEEILQVYLNTDDRIIIVDPEGEYVKIGEQIGATIIDLSAEGKTRLNPLDMNIQTGKNAENPISLKCDSVETLIEAMLGGEGSISPIERSIIQRVVRSIYRGYYIHMQDMVKRGITCDKAAMPTLQDLYAEMCKQKEPQAQYMATAIESYCVGNYALFAERTNIDTDNRVIIYLTNKLAGGMKEVGMHVCMDDTWNHVIDNSSKGYYTRIYIDEFHLYTKTRTSAAYMGDFYRRMRKFKGMPMAISQSVSDTFINTEAEAILKNSSFIVMMNQSPLDRDILQRMFNISTQMLEYITDQPPGSGLIYNGNVLVPMENEFPENTRLYSLMESESQNKSEKLHN